MHDECNGPFKKERERERVREREILSFVTSPPETKSFFSSLNDDDFAFDDLHEHFIYVYTGE